MLKKIEKVKKSNSKNKELQHDGGNSEDSLIAMAAKYMAKMSIEFSQHKRLDVDNLCIGSKRNNNSKDQEDERDSEKRTKIRSQGVTSL